MTPKEKAKELIRKFTIIADDSNGMYYMSITTKEKALIAVDEIINSNPHSNPFNTSVYSTMEYWLEVKSEIEKL
jgi:hypothetical protein